MLRLKTCFKGRIPSSVALVWRYDLHYWRWYSGLGFRAMLPAQRYSVGSETAVPAGAGRPQCGPALGSNSACCPEQTARACTQSLQTGTGWIWEPAWWTPVRPCTHHQWFGITLHAFVAVCVSVIVKDLHTPGQVESIIHNLGSIYHRYDLEARKQIQVTSISGVMCLMSVKRGLQPGFKRL